MMPKRAALQMIVWVATLALSSAVLPVNALAADIASSSPGAPSVSLQELEHGIADRLKRVEEFKFIEQEAAKLGVRAWLFGGTAAGYAHYVKWDMQREKGDPRFQKDRFDYDYTNIYRSTQDLDIVIDGSANQAEKLQTALQEKYPHLQGSKTAWEVRLLTQDMGEKLAILNNPDFMNQHTDSNSTGMIEITKPKADESVVRDVRDWKSKEPFFLKDVSEGKLHYYFSPKHGSTKFAKEGRNPPILSVIRYLTKAFQYELELRPEDLEQIKNVIREFDPMRDTQSSYVASWIEKNGKKLFQNAVNIEYAWDTLEKLGLRKKLSAIGNSSYHFDSLAWWMNKEPLRTVPLAKGLGKTARELGIDVLAHETNNFLAYESITRAHTGDPNVLISRSGVEGEVAAYGDGFYTAIGREGARGTGLTIRFHLNPEARLGSDFVYGGSHDHIIIRNKAALRVIPESLNIGPVEYFKMLADGGHGLGAGDRGILEKFSRRIQNKSNAIGDSEASQIFDIVRSDLSVSSPVLLEWIKYPVSAKFPELIHLLEAKGVENAWIASNILVRPHWRAHDEWAKKWAADLLTKGSWVDGRVAGYVLSHPYFQAHPEWIEKLVQEGMYDVLLAQKILSQPHPSNGHPEWVKAVLDRGQADYALISDVLSAPHWRDHPEFVKTLIDRGDDVRYGKFEWLAEKVLSKPHWKDHPELVVDLLKKTIQQYQSSSSRFLDERLPVIMHSILSQPHWSGNADLVKRLIELASKSGYYSDVLIAGWANSYAAQMLSHPQWRTRSEWPDLVGRLMDASPGVINYDFIVSKMLIQPELKDHPELIEKMIGKAPLHPLITALSAPHWKDHPELVKKLIPSMAFGFQYDWHYIDRDLLSLRHWKDHPELRRITGGFPPTYQRLKEGLEREAQGKEPSFSIRGCFYNFLKKKLPSESSP
jgi:hypothetical protein